MRVICLTTDTPHHRYWVQRVLREVPEIQLTLVVFEQQGYPWARKAVTYRSNTDVPWLRRVLLNPYVQPSALERMQQRYEVAHGFPPAGGPLEGTQALAVPSVNDQDVRETIRAASPDLLFVYGTGIIRPETFSLAPLGAVNAHGGLLPRYRGLDTNLWAALEGHPEDMAVALHRVDAGLDTGPVFDQRQLGRPTDLSLRSLRFHTTVLCTDMSIELLRRWARDGTAELTPQQGYGRTYGPMAALLKLRAGTRLRRWRLDPDTDGP